MLAIFIGALLGIAVLVGIIVLANQPPAPESCQVGEVCPPKPPPSLAPHQPQQPNQTLPPLASPVPTPAGQTPQPGQTAVPTPFSNSPPFVGGTVWRSTTLGYSFEYDPDLWGVEAEQDSYTQLKVKSQRFDIQCYVIGFAGSISVDAALQDAYARIDSVVIGRDLDERPYDALLGAGIGYVRGGGGVFSGTFKNADGTPGDPAGITVMAATNGRITIALAVLVHDPDISVNGGTLQHSARAAADSIVKTFLWEDNQ